MITGKGQDGGKAIIAGLVQYPGHIAGAQQIIIIQKENALSLGMGDAPVPCPGRSRPVVARGDTKPRVLNREGPGQGRIATVVHNNDFGIGRQAGQGRTGGRLKKKGPILGWDDDGQAQGRSPYPRSDQRNCVFLVTARVSLFPTTLSKS